MIHFAKIWWIDQLKGAEFSPTFAARAVSRALLLGLTKKWVNASAISLPIVAPFVSKSWLRQILRSFKLKCLTTSHLADEEGPKTLLFDVRGSGTELNLKSC